MNAERGRGGHRGRRRNPSGRNNGQRGGGHGAHRSNSDGQSANAFPPGLRVPDSQNQHSSSVPTASGWYVPDDSQQNGNTDLRQAAIQAADRALNVPVRQQGQYRGNRTQRRESGEFNATDNSPGLGHNQSGQNKHGASFERDSRPSSLGSKSSGTRQAQSNIVPIPQRYVNSSYGTFHSPSSGGQVAGTPGSRSRNGTAHAVLNPVALHTSDSTPVATIQSCICACVPCFGMLLVTKLHNCIGTCCHKLYTVPHYVLCALVAAMCMVVWCCAVPICQVNIYCACSTQEAAAAHTSSKAVPHRHKPSIPHSAVPAAQAHPLLNANQPVT